ncbi:hypothetical protein BGZ81_006228 [Podila clonocystis]|nr:hypothetical protein BGZ81_006228 [Podila clonocystis]
MDYRIYAGSADSLAQRQKLCKSNNYRIMLYEAIGCPKTIDATLIPDFYYKAGNIGLDSLVKFTDGDSHRFFFGDGPKQGAFLQRCDNLRILELRIRDPDSFSWALERNQVGGTQRHTQRFLRNLEQLTITMDTSLNVLHDAVVAFGQQLQHLKVSGSVSFNTISHAAYLDPRFSNQTKVGDWDLPCLKTMDLDLFADSGIYIGQFHCPNLDSLSINIHRRFPTRDVSNPPDSDGPCSHMDSVIPSPVWKLPRLRSLELHCKAVMLFDFDSLDHMPALERLVMIAGSSDYQPIPTCCIPRLAAYRCHKRTRVEVEVSQTPDPTVGTKWKDHWDLPRLKALRLEGPPSSVFCFKWLASCPSLESIHLRTSRHFQRLPLLSSSKNATILPIEAPSETRLKVAGFENVDDSGFDQSMVPLVESKLEEITLQGTWVMSMQDLTNVLTVYAPNLKFLDVDRLHAVYYCGEEEPWHGLQFLKAVDDVIGLENRDPAQGIMNGASTSASGMRPGSRLMNVKSSYTLATKDAETMGMLCVNQWIKQDKWPGRDVPWFAFQNDDFFRPGGGIDTEPNSTEDHNQVSHV